MSFPMSILLRLEDDAGLDVLRLEAHLMMHWSVMSVMGVDGVVSVKEPDGNAVMMVTRRLVK